MLFSFPLRLSCLKCVSTVQWTVVLMDGWWSTQEGVGTATGRQDHRTSIRLLVLVYFKLPLDCLNEDQCFLDASDTQKRLWASQATRTSAWCWTALIQRQNRHFSASLVIPSSQCWAGSYRPWMTSCFYMKFDGLVVKLRMSSSPSENGLLVFPCWNASIIQSWSIAGSSPSLLSVVFWCSCSNNTGSDRILLRLVVLFI